MKRVHVLSAVLLLSTLLLSACSETASGQTNASTSTEAEAGGLLNSAEAQEDEERPPLVAEKLDHPLVEYESLSSEGLLQSSETPLTYVGMGYNVLDNTYMEPSGFSFSYPVFKPEAVIENLQKKAPPASASHTIIGESVKDYSEQLKSTLSLSADYPVFSGNMSGELDMKKAKKENTYFVKSINGYVKEIHYLKATNDLNTMLDETFKEDLNSTLSPKELFQRYGTHVLIEAQMGARCTFNYSYSAASEESSSSIQGKVDLAYNCMSGSATTEQKEKNAQFMSATTFSCSLSGGPNISHLTFNDLLQNFPTWVAGIKDSSPTIYGISNINSLLPIWEFAQDPARKAELEAYFDHHGGDINAFLEEMSQISETGPAKEYIESIVITSDKDKSRAVDGNAYKGYERINVDLNAGAGGDYIYLWYKKTTDESKALRDIKFSYGKNSTINGYEKNYHDLNAGAGGDYIYLWTNSSDTSKNPISDILVVTGKNADLPSGYSYGMSGTERAELNKGAGGYYIYLGFSQPGE